MWHSGLAHPVSGGPVEGHGHPPGGEPRLGVHMAHTSWQHGPTGVAGKGRCDIPVLVAAGGAWYLGAMVGQSAKLGQGW